MQVFWDKNKAEIKFLFFFAQHFVMIYILKYIFFISVYYQLKTSEKIAFLPILWDKNNIKIQFFYFINLYNIF